MLNIKEIFKSDLDPNSSNWWAKDKIDKINFNFNQLEKGGPTGPLGTDGSDGATGVIGVKGNPGEQGSQGPIGIEGKSGKFTWNRNRSNTATNDTIFPNYQGTPEYSPIAIAFGAVIPGTGTNEYNEAISVQKTPAILLTDPATSDKNNLSLANNLKRGSYKTTKSGDKLIVSIGELLGTQAGSLEIKETVSPDGIRYKDQAKLSLNEPDDLLELKEIAGNQILISHVNSEFNFVPSSPGAANAGVDVEGDFLYTNNSLENKVLVSTDVAGNVEWKNRYEVFSALPRGSFIAIRESDFNNVNFNILDGSVIGSDNYLHVGYGRGRVGGDFEGWYLANGQKWGDGVLEFEVPNLNSYDTTVSNTDPSNALYMGPEVDATGVNPAPIIIGGSNTATDAVYNQSTGEYDVAQTTTTVDEYMTLPAASGSSDIAIKRNVNIIKLGESSLYCLTDPGVTSGITTVEIELTVVASTSLLACDAALETYLWVASTPNGTSTPTPNNWASGPLGLLYTRNVDLSAGPSPVAGWYQRDGISRYWDGSTWPPAPAFTCPVVYNIDLVVRTTVMHTDINGAAIPAGVSTQPFVIDTPLFKDATTLAHATLQQSIVGWVREFGTGNDTYRRYWNGVSFTGDSIDKLYVTQIDTYNGIIIEASALNNSNICTSTNTSLITSYYAMDTDPSNILSYTFNIDRIYNTPSDRGIIYVNTNWTTLQGSTPVIKIYDQNKPGSSVPYYSLVENRGTAGTKYALFTSASQVYLPSTCIPVIPVIPALSFSLNTSGGSSYNTGRYYNWNLSGTPQAGHVIRMSIYSTTLNYTIPVSTDPYDFTYDGAVSAYATFLNNLTISQWLAAGVYSFTQGNPPGFKPVATYDYINNRLTFAMNWQNTIGPPTVIPN
jgi:hypothetical protein